METIFWSLAVGSFVFGAIVGSFLNVVILRIPAGESIVEPPSRCPSCGREIAWYDNIPILSWYWLDGECRHCDAPISVRYTIVETLTASLSLAVWFKVALPQFENAAYHGALSALGLSVPYFLYFAFLALLVAITFVDLDHYVVPHGFTFPGIALGILSPWLVGGVSSLGTTTEFWPPVTPAESAVGAVAGGLVVMLVYYGYFALRGVEGIGGGDVTLMSMVGAWLGWPSLIFVLFAASLQGTLAAAVAGLVGSDWLQTVDEMYGDEEAREPDEQRAESDDAAAEDAEPDGGLAVPFGPFIAVAAVEHFFLGPYLPRLFSMSYLYTRWI